MKNDNQIIITVVAGVATATVIMFVGLLVYVHLHQTPGAPICPKHLAMIHQVFAESGDGCTK